jgi:phosphoribosylformimino-5-aminoimidazole carboxamide ribotide isomerase
MIIFPAIDLKDGKCVRLRRGIAEDVKVYADDPAEMARRFVDEGATWLHVVDLDGAFQGAPVHTDVFRISNVCSIWVCAAPLWARAR